MLKVHLEGFVMVDAKTFFLAAVVARIPTASHALNANCNSASTSSTAGKWKHVPVLSCLSELCWSVYRNIICEIRQSCAKVRERDRSCRFQERLQSHLDGNAKIDVHSWQKKGNTVGTCGSVWSWYGTALRPFVRTRCVVTFCS